MAEYRTSWSSIEPTSVYDDEYGSAAIIVSGKGEQLVLLLTAQRMLRRNIVDHDRTETLLV